MTPRVTSRNSGDVIVIDHRPRSLASRSDFVHPLIGLDFDHRDQLVRISASGPAAQNHLLECYRRHRASDEQLIMHLSRHQTEWFL